eukprot:14452149-Alexandrium_andersonii.AAC.1
MHDQGFRPPQAHAALKDVSRRWDPQLGAVVDHNGVVVPAPADPLPLALPAPSSSPSPAAEVL